MFGWKMVINNSNNNINGKSQIPKCVIFVLKKK